MLSIVYKLWATSFCVSGQKYYKHLSRWLMSIAYQHYKKLFVQIVRGRSRVKNEYCSGPFKILCSCPWYDARNPTTWTHSYSKSIANSSKMCALRHNLCTRKYGVKWKFILGCCRYCEKDFSNVLDKLYYYARILSLPMWHRN